MNADEQTPDPEQQFDEEQDEPYVQTVSTEEFVEAVEEASKKGKE
ncbi:hypothetical protein [Spirosoma spitsbergense]|nr:hypothetical protein [Spirosoma spitsbergense]